MTERLRSELSRRGHSAFRLGASVLLASTLVYYVIGGLTGMNAGYGKSWLSLADDHWELSECVYAAAITLTTVGYGDILGSEQLEIWRDAQGRHRWESATDPHQDPGFDTATATRIRDWSPLTRVMSAIMTIVGIAFFLYVIAQITSFFVEGAYEELRNLARARRRLEALSDHVIVCGAGEHGDHVVEALEATDIRCAVLDQDEAAVARVRMRHPQVAVLRTDASEEEGLTAAGIARARGVITVLGEDGMNVVAAVTAHQLNPGLRVVSRAFGSVSARRLTAAGCSTVISGRLAAIRLASEMVRPGAVDFLDLVLRPQQQESLRLEDVHVGERFAGRRVAESDGLGVVPLALRQAGGATTVYNPNDDDVFGTGDLLTVIGTPAQLIELREMLGSDEAPQATPHLELDVFDAPFAGPVVPDVTTGDLDDHFVVCGGGETGAWIVRDLHATQKPFVLVDWDPAVIEALREEMPDLVAVQGDAQDPETLSRAGVARARGLAATMASDRLNLLTVVTARQACETLRVVSLASDDASERRLQRAGVIVASKGRIGGRRMATEMLRPQLTGFLDRMLADPRGVRVECARVVDGAPAAGRALGEIAFWDSTGVRPVAVIPPGRGAGELVFDPEPHERLEPDARIVVIASPNELHRVVELVGAYE